MGSDRRVLKLTVAYDGTDFHGFAAQRDQRTVEGVLTDALARVLRAPVELSCAGRTDAGVHARGQVVSAPLSNDTADACDLDVVARSVNSQLGPEVVVRDATIVDGAFDARHSAEWRRYRFTVVNRPAHDSSTGVRSTRASASVSTPSTVRWSRCAANPWKSVPSYATVRRNTRPLERDSG